jgi:hypothetical protein
MVGFVMVIFRYFPALLASGHPHSDADCSFVHSTCGHDRLLVRSECSQRGFVTVHVACAIAQPITAAS